MSPIEYWVSQRYSLLPEDSKVFASASSRWVDVSAWSSADFAVRVTAETQRWQGAPAGRWEKDILDGWERPICGLSFWLDVSLLNRKAPSISWALASGAEVLLDGPDKPCVFQVFIAFSFLCRLLDSI